MSIAVHPQPEFSPTRRKKWAEIEYPTSDGKPMAETDVHRIIMLDHIAMLDLRYEHDPNVYVSGNNFIYYKERHPKKCISPDLYLVSGVRKIPRDCYKVWEEGGKLPDIVFEFTSKSTRHEDSNVKFFRYEQELKVPELVYFDPTGDYLNPLLQGHRLENGRYVRLELKNGRLYSEVLGLEIVAEGRNLRLYDPMREEWLLTPREQAHRAETEAAARRAADAKAEEQARRAEEQARRADAEAEARKASDAEINRLRSELEAFRQRSK